MQVSCSKLQRSRTPGIRTFSGRVLRQLLYVNVLSRRNVAGRLGRATVPGCSRLFSRLLGRQASCPPLIRTTPARPRIRMLSFPCPSSDTPTPTGDSGLRRFCVIGPSNQISVERNCCSKPRSAPSWPQPPRCAAVCQFLPAYGSF